MRKVDKASMKIILVLIIIELAIHSLGRSLETNDSMIKEKEDCKEKEVGISVKEKYSTKVGAHINKVVIYDFSSTHLQNMA